MPMQKYKRPQNRGGIRSIPLSNPHKIAWYTYMDKERLEGVKPKPTTELTVEAVFGSSREVLGVSRVEDRPKFVLLHSLEKYIELRMYWLGSTYWFVERNSLTRLEWSSATFESRTMAMSAYELYTVGRKNAIMWMSSKTYSGERLRG